MTYGIVEINKFQTSAKNQTPWQVLLTLYEKLVLLINLELAINDLGMTTGKLFNLFNLLQTVEKTLPISYYLCNLITYVNHLTQSLRYNEYLINV